jgi:alkyl hydroperoxide reductase subunit AhpF
MSLFFKTAHQTQSYFPSPSLMIFITMILCFILSEVQAQNKEIHVVDKSTNTAPFSTVYLRNLSNNSVNLVQAFAQDVVLDPEAKYEIICGGYTRLTLSGSEILARKVIYIQPLEYTFGAVQVEKLSKKSAWKISVSIRSNLTRSSDFETSTFLRGSSSHDVNSTNVQINK